MANDLSRIRKRRKTVELEAEDGGAVKIELKALSIDQIADLMDKHREFALSLASGAADSVVSSLFESGPGAAYDVIDAAAGLEPGSAAAADLAGTDTLRLVAAVVDLTLDADQLGKLRAEAGPLLERLGLAVVEEETSETPGPSSSNS